MPQLDASTYIGQIFWLIIAFALLWGLMRFLIIPRLEKIFSQREGYAQKLLEEARQLKSQTEDLRKQDALALDQARDYAKKQIMSTLEEAHLLKEAQKKDLDQEFEKNLHEAYQHLEKVKATISDKVDDISQELALLVQEKILRGHKE